MEETFEGRPERGRGEHFLVTGGGNSEYLIEPFGVGELPARIREAVLRHRASAAPRTLLTEPSVGYRLNVKG